MSNQGLLAILIVIILGMVSIYMVERFYEMEMSADVSTDDKINPEKLKSAAGNSTVSGVIEASAPQ